MWNRKGPCLEFTILSKTVKAELVKVSRIQAGHRWSELDPRG